MCDIEPGALSYTCTQEADSENEIRYAGIKSEQDNVHEIAQMKLYVLDPMRKVIVLVSKRLPSFKRFIGPRATSSLAQPLEITGEGCLA